jgi:DNA-binding SARP family transcriptional activator
MRFSLLGPLVVADGEGNRAMLAGPRLRVMLAALLLHANVPVPTGELAELVWDGTPPAGAVATLRSYAARLRRALGSDPSRIMARYPGYLIRAGRQELDVLEFEALCADARAALRAGQWADASAAAERALGLWQAAPLLDIPSEALRGEFAPRLERLRLQALEDGFDAGLRLGRYQELAPHLLDMAARYPLQERFHAQLMLALAAVGRRAQALDAYQRARRVLIDELGIEPGPELRAVHQRILAAGAQTAPPADATRTREAPDRQRREHDAQAAGERRACLAALDDRQQPRRVAPRRRPVRLPETRQRGAAEPRPGNASEQPERSRAPRRPQLVPRQGDGSRSHLPRRNAQARRDAIRPQRQRRTRACHRLAQHRVLPRLHQPRPKLLAVGRVGPRHRGRVQRAGGGAQQKDITALIKHMTGNLGHICLLVDHRTAGGSRDRCSRLPPRSRALRTAGAGRGAGGRAPVVCVAPARRAGGSGVDDQHRAQVERVVVGSGRVNCVHDVIPFHRDIWL